MPLSHSIDVQAFLNEHPFSRLQWFLFLLCFLAILLDGFDTAVIGYIAPSLITEWHASRQDLAPVLSASLFGLAAGALLAGPLADRFGRKSILLGAFAIIGFCSLGSAFAGNLGQLVGWRLAAGLGLGAAMPSAITLFSEFCPSVRRATLVNTMYCGFPLGAALGGFLATWLIPIMGWRGILLLGGVAPFVLAALFLFAPESVHYLMARGLPEERIHAVLRRMAKGATDIASFNTTKVIAGPDRPAGGIGVVLSARYLTGTVMLWIANFCGLIIFYAVVNWMPVLLKNAGFDPAKAGLISSLFSLGGIGAALSGWLMDRLNANMVIAVGFALTALGIYCIGQTAGNTVLLTISVFVAGAFLTTSITSLPALAAAFYPTAGRATGIAWMLGVGRFGGIAGSFLVAMLSRWQVTFSGIFTAVALAGLSAVAALVIKQVAHRQVEQPEPDEVLRH